MHVLLSGGVVDKYPYSPPDLRLDRGDVSFAVELDEATLAAFNVFPVVDTPVPPYDSVDDNLVELDPVLQLGVWNRQWSVVAAPPEEVQQRLDALSLAILTECDVRLSDSDWTQLLDAPITPEKQAEWVVYRNGLRSIELQGTFPRSVVWPTEPV